MSERRRHERLMTLLDSQGERLYATLARLTLRHDVAADLFQELFVRLSASDTFGSADDPAAFAWRAALNLASEWRRRKRADVSLPPDDALVASSSSPLEQLLHDEQIAQLLEALEDLSELARCCFVLRFFERMPYEQIARQLGKTAHQVRGHCHAAVKQLREKLCVEVNDDR